MNNYFIYSFTFIFTFTFDLHQQIKLIVIRID